MRKLGIWNFQAFMNSKRIVAAATIWGNKVPYKNSHLANWRFVNEVNFITEELMVLKISQLLALIIFVHVSLMRENMRKLRENLKHKILPQSWIQEEEEWMRTHSWVTTHMAPKLPEDPHLPPPTVQPSHNRTPCWVTTLTGHPRGAAPRQLVSIDTVARSSVNGLNAKKVSKFKV